MDDTLVDRIYEAGLVPHLWPGILADLTWVLGGVGTVLIADRRGEQQVACSTGFEQVISGFIEDGWPSRNQRFSRAIASRLPGFMTELDLFSEDELMADPMLHGFFLPRGLGRELGTVIRPPTEDILLLTVQRRFQEDPPPAETIAKANALRPHIARAAMMSARIGLDRAKTAAEVLQSIGLPAAVLTSQGQVLALNEDFQGLMPSVAIERGSRIGLATPSADDLLVRAIRQVANRGIEAGTRSIPVQGESPDRSAIANLIPIRRSACNIFVGAASVLLLSSVKTSYRVNATVMEGLFDLTPAEMKICSAIVNGGHNLTEASKNLQVSYFTAKTHLRSVFQKTGTRSQSDLVRLILGLSS